MEDGGAGSAALEALLRRSSASYGPTVEKDEGISTACLRLKLKRRG